jgi:hypothetical protein
MRCGFGAATLPAALSVGWTVVMKKTSMRVFEYGWNMLIEILFKFGG